MYINSLVSNLKTLAEIIGYGTVLLSAILGIYTFLKPIITKYLLDKEILSPENVKNIKDIAYRALYKSQLLLNHTGMMVYTCLPNGEFIYASDELCKLFNLSNEQMMGFGWTLAIPETHRDEAHEKWLDCVKNKKPYQDTYPIKTPNGIKTVWTSTRICFDYDAVNKKFTDKILFFIGTVAVVD